jgi:hypothetical protein
MTDACHDTATDVTDEEAHLILEPYFEVVRERYLDAGLERCEQTRLIIDRSMHDTSRHFAACQTDGKIIMLAPEMVELPEETVLAITAHELGHACDFLYPGEFAMAREDAPALRRSPESMKAKHWHRWLRDWEARDEDLVETTADAIAHYVLGVRYGYRGPCLIQTFGAQRLRPVGLR